MAIVSVRRVALLVLAMLGGVLWLSALLLLAQTAQNSEIFGRLYNWILFINVAGVVVLLALIGVNLVRLVRDYRRHVPGARLNARMVAIFGVLVVAPIILVYYFSVEFLNRGIDSWFHVEIDRGLSQALDLSRATLERQERDYVTRTVSMSRTMAGWTGKDLVHGIGRLQRENGALEIVVYGRNNRVVAFSSGRPTAEFPTGLAPEIDLQVKQSGRYVALIPVDDNSYHIQTVVALPVRVPGDEERVVEALYPVAERVSSLANSVQQARTRYAELEILRAPLKTNFTLTLSLILLLAVLTAVWGAFFAARRLVAPIQALVAGTRAVAKGDFDTKLPIPARDEIGFLVNSFNDMTLRLAKTRELAKQSQQQVESERASLGAILARLSTGVIALESDLAIRTANEAAGTILGTNLEASSGESLSRLAAGKPMLAQFVDVCRNHIDAGDTEWREQIILRANGSRRVLMCACTALPGDADGQGGHVVVFDDITELLQAQKEAAWGEVARRLAHEIKNPLTPIQLSAERMRRRYLGEMSEMDAQVLDRATHTIVQQVEAMKDMVNAFSEYARAPELDFSLVDVNRLIIEIADLYKSPDVEVTLELDDGIPRLEADPGRVRQILHNLLRNAVEALDRRDNQKIRVSSKFVTEDDIRMAKIVVEDNGPGFPADAIGQVFDPYVTSKPKGTGLGLAIVKKLVEEHGGRIEAGNGVDGGARIHIELPVDEADRTAMLTNAARRGEGRREHA